jgi:type VI secretion system protein ImpL
MSYLYLIRRVFFSRQTLLFMVIVLIARTVWLFGPQLEIGGHYPLAGVLPRVLVLVVLLAVPLCRLLKIPLGFAALALACLLLLLFGSQMAAGDLHWLVPAGVLLIVLSVVGYAAYRIYRLWHATHTGDGLLQRILHPSADESKPAPAAKDDVRAVSMAVAKAVEKLKRMSARTSGLRRVLEGERYLYDLPWYMVLGSSGAGKTTLVLNSGLDFPDAEQMSASSTLRRAETAHCDWWLTNEAVLIDTAGRYTAQGDAASDDKKEAGAAAGNAAEWRGFLAALRKHRPRAPINGALLTVSVEELLHKSPAERTVLAAAMRARLGELRETLGIRFPVYVVVTKLDLLPGFPEYFQSLSAEGRAQVLGFTLRYEADRASHDRHERRDLRASCADELKLLEGRLEAGLDARLHEEYEADRRRKLYALPSEFRALSAQLTELVGLVFLDSKYDDTQLANALRGVYFTSAAQTHDTVSADRSTVLQRLRRGLAGIVGDRAAAESGAAPTAYRGYFLRNLFQNVVLAEAHLVRPNLHWELRFRSIRIVGHLLSVAVAAWLIGALIVSFDNNREYLAAIANKTDSLASQLTAFRKAQAQGAMASILNASHDLPEFRHLDLDSPGGAYRYGLYTAPRIVDVSSATYEGLLRQLLLPQIANRFERVLAAKLDANDAEGTYQTLSVYLMLYDKARYDAKVIKSWVLRDWAQADSAASMGDRDVMAAHLDALFVEGEAVEPRVAQNADLVRRAREFLGRNPASGRLYERAMAAMGRDVPENMTLLRAAGPEAAAVFALAANSPLEKGVPGLYTYEGYHEVFSKRLPEFLARARSEDAWVMGRAVAEGGTARAGKDPLMDEIWRQYLTDYGNYWQQFLADVRPAVGQGGSLELDLQTLRVLVAPDSPLARLARTAVRQTSLSAVEKSAGPSLTDSALAALGKVSGMGQAGKAAGAAATIRQEELRRMEMQLVDDRFTALREIVTGQADVGDPAAGSAPVARGGAMQLDAIIGLLNEQYARLVVVDNALSTHSMPPPGDVGTTLQMEAGKLPAPFRAILAGVSSYSMQKVDQGVGTLLAMQVESSVGQQCRRLIEGKYPFAASSQDVDIDDFNSVFAPGGLLDAFFQKTLAAQVDTSIRPWRYKSVNPGMPPMLGPSLEPFERADAIRQVFFREPGAMRMAWKMGVKVASMDPEITDLALDFDGQTLRYAHGPVTEFPVSWPGPRGGAMATITANPRVHPDTSTLTADGPWAPFRLLDRGRRTETSSSSRLLVDFDFDGRHAVLEIVSGGQPNAVAGDLLKGFRCPAM